MSSYATLIDYLGDLRAPERLSVPPGGSIGPLDAYLIDIAETVRATSGRDARKAIIRREAAVLFGITLPPPDGGSTGAAMKRLADWCDDIDLVADNANGGMPCTARFNAHV